MPEEGIETDDLKERLEEVSERIEGETRSAPWTLWLSLSTALLAVLAAIASLESGGWANDAIILKNDAVLHQSKADDEWALYQARGVKHAIFATQAEGASTPELAKKWRGEAEREKAEGEKAMEEAKTEEDAVKEASERSEHALHTHHQFAKGVTIFQVSIALSAIGALTRRKAMWWLSLGIGAIGAVFFVLGFVHA
ncbi:MAG: DUF4337 domain-containing protein [Polyangiaceae bacterium]